MSRRKVVEKDHPAKFSDAIVDSIIAALQTANVTGRGIDPFAGKGGAFDKIAAGAPSVTALVGVELEPEWAVAHPAVEVGNALELVESYGENSFDFALTSPCYGNRMADHHDAREICSKCKGKKVLPRGLQTKSERARRLPIKCDACDGRGTRDHKRMTYKAKLERDPTAGSSAVMQWGREYRTFHYAALAQIQRVVRPHGLFVLNISDHVRRHKVQHVVGWYTTALVHAGWALTRVDAVETPRMGFGENADARVPHEFVLSFVNHKQT